MGQEVSQVFKVSRTRNGVSIKNVSRENIELVSVNIYYYYTVTSTTYSLEESLRERSGRRLSRENIVVGKRLGPGDVLEIEFRPPENIDSVEIFYNDERGTRRTVKIKV